MSRPDLSEHVVEGTLSLAWLPVGVLVVPTYDRLPGSRVGTVRRDWVLSAAAYLLAASVLVAGVVALD